jgi:hypothetical protein
LALNALRSLSVHRGLSARAILVVVVVVVLLPTLLVAGWLASVSSDAENAQIEQNVQQRAHEISAILDREVIGIKSMLTALATSGSLHESHLQTFHAKAVEISQQLGVQIILYDVEKNRHVVHSDIPFGMSLESYSYPRALVDRAVRANGPFVTGIIKGPIAKRYGIGVILPVRSVDSRQYLLAAAFFVPRILAVFELAQLRAPYVASIVDRNGLIVARSSKHEQFVGQQVPAPHIIPTSASEGALAAP